MGGDVRGEAAGVSAGEIGGVEMFEVGVFGGVFADGEIKEAPGLFVDGEDLGDVAVAGGDRIFKLARLEVVEVHLSPAGALGEPKELVRGREIVPVDAAIAGLEEFGGGLVEDIADGAGGDIGDTEGFVFVVTGGGDEGEGFRVGRPLDVVPAARTTHIVAECRPVLVGRHFETNDVAGGDIDDHSLNRGDVPVADEGVAPGFERGVADGDGDHVHHAGVALVLLEGGDVAGIGRPNEDGVVGVGPAGVVGGVAEVGDAVMGELGFGAGVDVAEPEIPIAEEGGAGAVRGGDGGGAGAAGSGLIFCVGDGGAGGGSGASGGSGDGAAKLFTGDSEGEGAGVAGGVEIGELEGIEMEVGGDGGRRGVGDGGEDGFREGSVVEGGGDGLRGGIDENEGSAAGVSIAVPEAIAGEEGGAGDGVGDERIDHVGEAALGEAVIGIGEGAAGGLRDCGDGGEGEGGEEGATEGMHAAVGYLDDGVGRRMGWRLE